MSIRCVRDGAIMMCKAVTQIAGKRGMEAVFECKCGVTATLKFDIPEMTNAEKMENDFTRRPKYKIGERKLDEKLEVNEMTVELENKQVEDWDKTYPHDEISWVDDDMKEIQRDWILWDKYNNCWAEITFSEGQYTMNEGAEDERKEQYQEVDVAHDGGLTAIGDDFVYHKRGDAFQKFTEICEQLLSLSSSRVINLSTNLNILLFKHGSDGFSPACTVEWHGDSERRKLKVNKLGFGVFIRRELLERLSISYHKLKSGDGE